MPQLFEPMLVDSVKTRFRSFNITLPTMVSGGPRPNIGQFLVQSRQTAIAPAPLAKTGTLKVSSSLASSVKLGAGSTLPPRPVLTAPDNPASLFRAASGEKADVDFQTEANNEFSRYIAAVSRAIVSAHDNWRYTAFLKGVTIMGPLAVGGTISGPLLSVNMNMNGPQQGLWEHAAPYTRAIADGLASCWREWEQSVRVPSLPWYPSFALLPMPTAAPTPNIPTPMTALTWSPALLSLDTIKSAISRKLSQPGPYSDELFTSIAAGFAAVVGTWLSVQVVAGVLGKGPIPTFAPPYVPVGPVVGGSIIEAPPHFGT